MKSTIPGACLVLLASSQAPAVEALSHYTNVKTIPIEVPEASGVAYNWDTDTLFAIGDEGVALCQISKTTGQIIDSMPFQVDISPREARALDDPEGVTYLGHNTFMIADERYFTGRITTYQAGVMRTQADLAPTSYSFGPYAGNTGLEGITYDPIENAIWGVKERDPFGIYRMTGVPFLTGSPDSVPVVTQPIEQRYITRWFNNYQVDEGSDIYALAACPAFTADNPRRSDLLMLSRDSNRILEIDRSGNVIDSLDISGIGRDTIEGMTMDNDGVLYLVSEGSVSAPDDSPLKSAGLHILQPPAPKFSVQGIALSPAGDGGMVAQLSWDSTPGESYIIEFTADLSSGVWTQVSSMVSSGGASTTGVSQSLPGGAAGFLRIRKVTTP